MTASVVETRPAPLNDNYHLVVGPEEEVESTKPAIASGLEVDMRRSPTKPARPDKTEEPPTPQHPIPFMQDAFAESLFEATYGGKIPKPKLRAGDAKTRRAELLDQAKSDPPLAALWRYRPGQVNHELRRLMAQISFGVYLLLNGMANSQALVVSILQGHIDEVDEFLETTLEDIGLATKDLQDRIAHLKLPMDNMGVFETMLEDQKFRNQILSGNRKIDHIVGRTQIALQQTVQDLAEGVSSTREFSIYLAEQEEGPWRRDRPDVIDIYNAMKGNTDGWFNAYIDLQAQASTLNGLVVRLNGMVAEMDRTAAAVNQRVTAAAAATVAAELAPLRVSSPKQTPRHTPQGSDASSVVQQESPVSKIPSAPPRLSLRLSSIVTMQSTGGSSFFDIPTGRGSLMVLRAHETVAESSLETQLEELEESDLDDEDLGGAQLGEERVATPPPEENVVQVTEVVGESEELLVPQSPPARNPRRLSERPPIVRQIVIEKAETADEEKEPGGEEADKKEEPEADLGLYILQPRTYTPQPTSPLPSPRVFDRSPFPMDDQPLSKAEPKKPRLENTLSTAISVAKEQRREPMSPLSPRSPTFDPTQLRRQPSKARLVSIGARAPARKPVPPKVEVKIHEVEIPLPEMEPPVPKVEPPVCRMEASPASVLEEFPIPNMEAPPLPKMKAPPIPDMAPPPIPTIDPLPVQLQTPPAGLEVAVLPEPAPEPEPEVLPRHKSSLRQRVSLKTNPPESIQVPPPNAPELHRPLYPSPRKNQAPDSAYGSDPERAPAKPTMSAIPDFPIPSPRPMLVPSPHSDLQFFRPVQASPHSPLQQRPHTSGNVSSRGHPPQQVPPRNIPSAMGMSMLSSMTSATQDSIGSQQTLKKKRSAFGWLKKAFSLDEEERQAFEQKKKEQARNLYYDGKSPKFVDGKRIPQVRRPETQYQGY